MAFFLPEQGQHFSSPHQIMGIVTMCFMYLQPLNAIFRPHAPARPGEKRTRTRRVWELLHKNLGRLTALLAFATAGVGLYLPMVELAGVCEGMLGAGSFSVCIISRQVVLRPAH